MGGRERRRWEGERGGVGGRERRGGREREEGWEGEKGTILYRNSENVCELECLEWILHDEQENTASGH